MKITHDMHVHTHFSDCAHASATAENYIAAARELGIKVIGIADHMWDSENIPVSVVGDKYPPRTVEWAKGYNVMNHTYNYAARNEFSVVKHDDIKVIFGCECEYDYARRGVALTEKTAKELDFVIVPNSHTHLTMPSEFFEPHIRHAEFMYNAFLDIVNSPVAKYITAIAHPFEAGCCYYDCLELLDLITDAQYKECCVLAKEKNIAFEINVAKFTGKSEEEIKNHPSSRLVKIAKDTGCKFTFGTDSHANDEILARYEYCNTAARAFDIKESDLADIMRI